MLCNDRFSISAPVAEYGSVDPDATDMAATGIARMTVTLAPARVARAMADRTVMHVLYGLHTVAWASMGALAVIALIVNYIKRSDEQDTLYVTHHNYMISTFWWTVLWLVVTSWLWLLFVLPGAIATPPRYSRRCG